MRIYRLLVSSLLVVATTTAIANEEPNPKQLLKDGIAAMRTGQKTVAWETLYPLAQNGDVQAMYYLGEMMLRSPEYGDNLQRAIKFFSVAAQMGHEGSIAMLPRVQQLLKDSVSGALPTIAGTSGTPTSAEIARATQRLNEYKAEVLRFTDRMPDGIDVPRIEVMVFLNSTDSSAEGIYRIAQGVKNQYGTKIRLKFFVVIDPAKWTPGTSPTGGSNIPPNGFTPDFKGALARQHGVTQFPAVVLLPESGKPQVLQDLSTLNTIISRLL